MRRGLFTAYALFSHYNWLIDLIFSDINWWSIPGQIKIGIIVSLLWLKNLIFLCKNSLSYRIYRKLKLRLSCLKQVVITYFFNSCRCLHVFLFGWNQWLINWPQKLINRLNEKNCGTSVTICVRVLLSARRSWAANTLNTVDSRLTVTFNKKILFVEQYYTVYFESTYEVKRT